MRWRIVLWMLLLGSLGVRAQELNSPQLSQYLADNPFVLAPTYAGIGDHVKIRLNGLSQWVGIKDAPHKKVVPPIPNDLPFEEPL